MIVPESDFVERRDYERIKVNTAVTVYYGYYPNSRRECEGICIDLSQNGISIEADTVIPIGTECRVVIHDGHSNKSRYQALIEIRRVEQRPKQRFLLGASVLQTY